MAKKGLMHWEIFVQKGDEYIPYDSMTPEEKKAFGKRMNQRAIRAAALAEGYDVEFHDLPSEGTA